MASEGQPATQDTGAFDPCCLGYGVQWGLRLTLLFADTLFIGHVNRGTDAFCNALMLGMLAVYAAALVAFRNAGDDKRAARQKPGLPWLVERSCLVQAILIVLGVALVVLASLGTHFQPVSIAAGSCLGCGMGVGVYGWTYLYMRRGPGAARSALASSWLLGVGVFALLALLPSLPRLLAIAALGVGSTLMELRYARTTWVLCGERPTDEGCAGDRVGGPAPSAGTPDNTTWTVAPIAAAATVLGFAYGMSGPLQLSGGGASTGDFDLLVNHLATLLVASLAASLVLFARTGRRDLDLLPVFLAAFTLDTTAAVVLPFAGSDYLTPCATVFGIVNRVTGMLVLYSCATLPGERAFFRAGPILLGASGLGLTLGIVVGNSLFAGIADNYAVLTVITLVIMYVIFLALTVVLVARGRHERGERTPSTHVQAETAGAPEALQAARACDSATMPAATSAPSGDEDVLERIAALYGLSEREREVMGILAKGRGVPFAAEQLGISQNTVKAYAKSLYKKLAVHSREELMDLAERFEKERPAAPR